MESIHVQEKLRPRRFAFMVEEGDFSAVLMSVSLNTGHWGGMYNPLVPITPRDKCLGLLQAFDPDDLVDLTGGGLDPDLREKYKRRIVHRGRLVEPDPRTGERCLRFGFDMLPILHFLHEKEVKFLSDPTHAALISTDASEGWLEYLAFVFGSFQWLPESSVDFQAAFLRALKAQEVRFDPAHPADQGIELIFPIQMTVYGLRLLGGGLAGFSSHIVYIGDHRSWLDLVDFWNIRATGRTILFVPLACFHAYEPLIRAVAEAGHYPINSHLANETDLVRGPSVSEEAFRAVCESIGPLDMPAVRRRHRGPRYGNPSAHYVGDIHVAEIEAQTSEEISVLSESQMTPVKLISPTYLEDELVGTSEYRWTVELTMLGGEQSNDFLFAFPAEPAVEEVVRGAFITSWGEVRIGRQGVVIPQEEVRPTLFLHPVRTVDVFHALFQQAGFQAEPSLPGRYAEQIIRKMGHLHYDCRVFKLRGVRDVLERLSNGSVLTKGNMQQIVTATTPDAYGQNWRPDLYDGLVIERNQRGMVNFTNIFNVLLEKKVIRPGFTFTCQNCFASGWYHVSEFGEEFTCRFCFSRQRVNFGSMRDWQYKADGLFQIPHSASGSLAVIISLWRFAGLHFLDRGRYLTSVLLRETKGTREYEVDYAYLLVGAFDTSYQLVLGQVKGYCDFAEDELTRMAELSDRFVQKPYLAFSTLKEAFSPPEKDFLTRLINNGHKVIALIRLELDPYNLYDRFEHAPKQYSRSLDQLSQNTIHLNLT